MVTLTNADPNPPVHGQSFSIEARAGVAPYTFTYQIDEQDPVDKEQSEAKFEMDIPENSAGESLTISVVDSTPDRDSQAFRIS